MKKPTLSRLARVTFVVASFAALPSLAATPLLVPYTGAVAKAERKDFKSQGERVKLNIGELESLKPGDVVDFTVPGGRTYAVVFESVEKKGGGIKSWVGYLRDTPDHLRVILTTGPGGTFGSILTPDGEFRLMPGEGHDWLVDMKVENPPPVDLSKDVKRAPPGAVKAQKVEPSADAAAATDVTATGATPAAGTTATAKSTPAVVTIDVMVAYSAGYAARLGANLQTRIAQLITSANTYFADSQVGIKLRLVKTVQVNYSDASAPNDNDTVLQAISPVNGTSHNQVGDAAFSSLESLRTQYGADLVTFLRSNGENALSGAGIAWAPNSVLQAGWKPYMYSVVTGCTGGCDFVWAHEVGHNLGNMHDRATVAWQAGGEATLDPTFDQGATPYAYGYYSCGGSLTALTCNPNLPNGSLGGCAANQQPECNTGVYNGSTVPYPGAGTNNIADIMAYFHYSTKRNLVFSNPLLNNCSGDLGIPVACGIANVDDTARSMNEQRVAVSNMLPTMVTDVTTAKRKVDFDANGFGDLAWKNGNTGAQGVWLMNGSRILDSGTVSNGSNVFIAQVGDYDGDGHSDLLWRNATDGSYSIQLMNGKTATTTASIFGGGSAWQVVDKGDFNGDGKTDLLWRNMADGSYGIWLMNGTSASAYGTVFYGGSGWTIKLVADFNGDGKSDLLGVNADGSVRIWLMDGTSGWAANTILAAGSTWQPVLAADFDGDGMADLLWRNSADGSYGIWLMSGMNIKSYGYVFYANNGITITHAVDLDGDGKADLVGTLSDGTVRVWTMNGISGTAAANLFAAGSGWTPVYSDDFNGDGKADLLLRNADGRYQLNLMNGTGVLSSTQVLGPGTGWDLTP